MWKLVVFLYMFLKENYRRFLNQQRFIFLKNLGDKSVFPCLYKYEVLKKYNTVKKSKNAQKDWFTKEI